MREGESDFFSKEGRPKGVPKVLLGWGVKPRTQRGYNRESAREKGKMEMTPN